MQPLEDAGLGGGTFALDASVESIDRTADGFSVHVLGTTNPCDLALEADDVIAATGFRTPLLDLPGLGVQTVGQGRIPALTPFFEATGAPGIYFAGNTTQGAPGLRKHGVGASSPAVHGFRYNARVLAEEIAARHFDVRPERQALAHDEVVPFLAAELAHGPEIWTQKAYLARVVTLGGSPADGGIEPLAHFLDADGPDAVAATIEMNAAGAIYPVVYVRRNGTVDEHPLEPDVLNAFDAPDYLAQLESVLK
jgi:hypothetical protein